MWLKQSCTILKISLNVYKPSKMGWFIQFIPHFPYFPMFLPGWGPRSIAFSWFIRGWIQWFMVDITIVFMGIISWFIKKNWGGPILYQGFPWVIHEFSMLPGHSRSCFCLSQARALGFLRCLGKWENPMGKWGFSRLSHRKTIGKWWWNQEEMGVEWNF